MDHHFLAVQDYDAFVILINGLSENIIPNTIVANGDVFDTAERLSGSYACLYDIDSVSVQRKTAGSNCVLNFTRDNQSHFSIRSDIDLCLSGQCVPSVVIKFVGMVFVCRH